jgi:uncharacterized membrane protein
MTYLAGILATLAFMTSAIMAGFFFAYSISVMWGLDAAMPASAIDGMQGINTVIQNPWFFPNFFGARSLPSSRPSFSSRWACATSASSLASPPSPI